MFSKSVKKNILNKNILNNLNLIICVVLVCIILIFVIKLYKNSIEKFEDIKYNNGLNNVDKILYINLENKKDRNEYILEQLKKYGVNDDKIYRINAHYTPGNGHLGCAKSHLDAVQYAIDNNLENVIVFEDDFTFSPSPEETKDLFDKFFNQVGKEEWNIVLLSHTQGQTTNTDYPFIQKITGAQDGAGYIVNKKYFETLKNSFMKSVNNMKQEKTNEINFEPYAIDQVWKEKQLTDNWMVLNPLLGKQNKTLESSIETITKYN